MLANPIDRSKKVVDAQGRPTQDLSLFAEQVAKLFPIVGSGSPEGVVEAEQSRFYMDETGTPVLYIKQLSDISGDRSQGWVAV